ncbi:MAG: hypothetical protein JWO63_2062 [Frankiales bacterium]|nr:hypothetical protein [Frankiales bacterium]
MLLPFCRGPVSALLTRALIEAPGSLTESQSSAALDKTIADEDLQLALWICYELHYRGFAGVADGWEWDVELLRLRGGLEAIFEVRLAATVDAPRPDGRPIAEQLADLVASDDGPSLSRHLQRDAPLSEFREFVMHRSVYHLKEADPHSWAIPRLHGRAKAALVEIQADEYGNGQSTRMHSELFRDTMRALSLDDSYGAYVNRVPGPTLAISNAMSLFGLHRSRRGAAAGHLAAFEMTSSAPNRRYSQGLHRLGFDLSARRFYEEHITADALHEQVAAHDLCGSLVADEPELAADVLFGAACALRLDGIVSEHLLGRWASGRSSFGGGDVAALRRLAPTR